MLKYLYLPALLAAAPAVAQQAPTPDAAARPDAANTGSADLAPDTVIVTATRAPTAIDRVAASVTVLDKLAIDRAQDIGVSELLLRTPGVSLSRTGGYGTATSLRIRGAEGDQTVVVIDGVKLNDPSGPGGGYNFGDLLVGDAARIEVLRGPQSILWGSQAIGGVVNIVTPLPTTPLGATFDVEGGSRDTVSARAALGGRTGPLAWRLGGQTFTTNGISALAPDCGGRARDGYANQGASGRAQLDIADGVSAEVRGFYTHGRVDLDGYDADFNMADTLEYSLTDQVVGYAGLNAALFDGRLRNRFGYGYTDIDRYNYNPELARPLTFRSRGRNERFDYQGALAIAKGWDAAFGVERERSSFRTVSPSFDPTASLPAPQRASATLTGEYAQVTGTLLDGLTLTGGARHDDHSRFGSKFLFAGGAVWALPSGTVLRANYGEGFKAPTLYQLFSEYGNERLDAERAKGWEAGVEQSLLGGAVTVGATYFERRTTGLIGFTSCDYPSTTDPLCVTPGTADPRFGYYQNVQRAFARGVESVAQARIGGLLLDANYSYTLSEDRSPDSATFGKWLQRRPRNTANASATYQLRSGASAGVAVRYSGKTYEDAANTIRLDGYTLVDLRAELPVSPKVSLFARAENLFDERYETVYRYNTLGRSIHAGFRGRF